MNRNNDLPHELECPAPHPPPLPLSTVTHRHLRRHGAAYRRFWQHHTLSDGLARGVHLKRDQHQAITLCPSETLQTCFLNFPHASLIGLPPGSQVRVSESFPTQRRQRKRKR